MRNTSFQTLLWPPVAALGAAVCAASALAAAYIAEYGYGIFPCTLCLWQRAPLWTAVPVALVLLLAGRRRAKPLLLLLAALFALEAGIAAFHVGVEQHWWAGTSSCTAAEDAEATDAASLRERLLGTPIARCDEVTWRLLGQSLALWNIPFSLVLCGWMLAALRRQDDD